MFLFASPVLAQANPENLQVTSGQAAAALITLGMLVASICMIGIWISRYLRRDCCLTPADRGVLRCPPVVTVVAVVLTALMGILGLAGSLTPAAGAVADPAVEPGEVLPEAAPEVVWGDRGLENPLAFSSQATLDDAVDSGDQQQQSDEAAATDETESEAETEGEALRLQEKFRSGIQVTLVLDVFLLAIFGAAIWLNRIHGPAALPEDLKVTTQQAAAADPVSEVLAYNQWPDLDAATVTTSTRESVDPYRSLTGTAADDAEMASEMPATVLGGPPPVHDGTEAVTVLGELRYAGEVFLVALAPTTLLRLVIAYFYMTVSGTDEIPQHPFLELMRDGIDTPMLLTIAFMAVVMAPLMEELLYRVVILGGMAQAGWPLTGLWLSSILFGIAHGFPDCLALLPLAFLLGFAYLRRRSYLTVILVHFLFNAFNLTVAGLALF